MISIIIPVYNTAKYLSQCLNSIMNQTYKNIEIILVNDASPDNSLSFCQSYRNKDSRIIIINKNKNEGVDKARFSGIKKRMGNIYYLLIQTIGWKTLKYYPSCIKKQRKRMRTMLK